MRTRHGFLIAFFLCVAIGTYEDVHNCGELPWPPRIIGAGIAFAILDIFSLVAEELAGVMAIGIVLAFLLNTIEATHAKAHGTVGNIPKSIFSFSCQHDCGTIQPTAYQSIDQTTPGTTVT